MHLPHMDRRDEDAVAVAADSRVVAPTHEGVEGATTLDPTIAHHSTIATMSQNTRRTMTNSIC